MKKAKMNKKCVGAGDFSMPTSKDRQNKGITLIALVVTIVVMLILVSVTITMAINGGLFEYAQSSTEKMHEESDKEQIASAIPFLKYIGTSETFIEGLKKEQWCSNAEYDEESKATIVTMKGCGHQYKILEDGTIIKREEIAEKNNDIILSGNLPVGVYTLRYEDANGIMEDYAEICTLEIKVAGEDAVYEGLMEKNCAPVSATNIGVYNISNQKVANISLDALNTTNLGDKQYSFAAISDTHVGAYTAENDLKKALQYFENDSDIEFTTICGDLTLSGSDTNLNLYKSTVDNYATKPVYAISGNHEANASFAPLAIDSLKPYTGQDLYYSFTKGNDVYIMMGMYDNHDGQEFAEGELQWLYETLEANRNKRCLLFMHLFPREGSGDAVDLDLEGDMLNNTQGKVFYSLLSHYSNVIYFHGHSHQEFAIQEVNEMNNYDNIFGCHSIHIPSLAYPKYISGSTLEANYDASEGYVVDVYENSIVLKGRDFVGEKFLPIASYCLNTSIKNVEANTYYDPTGTIANSNSNVFKSGSTWYEGSVDKTTITKIILADNYTGFKSDESWDASISNNNQITVYRTGTELTIVGNENGIIANANSNEMFSGFTNVTQIEGLEKLKTFNIINLDGMFKNCNRITSLNLSNFDDAKPENMFEVFSGCKSIKNIDISNFDLTSVYKFSSLFYGCSSLESINLGNNVATNVPNVYCAGMFSDCSSITEIDLSVFTGKGLHIADAFKDCRALKKVTLGNNKLIACVNTFYRCHSLEELDISGFDFSNIDNMNSMFYECKVLKTLKLPAGINTGKVKTMTNTFKNCALLTLDCSGWATTSLTDITGFNEGAPGVISPVLNNF